MLLLMYGILTIFMANQPKPSRYYICLLYRSDGHVAPEDSTFHVLQFLFPKTFHIFEENRKQMGIACYGHFLFQIIAKKFSPLKHYKTEHKTKPPCKLWNSSCGIKSCGITSCGIKSCGIQVGNKHKGT